jgi:hypothetical protein
VFEMVTNLVQFACIRVGSPAQLLIKYFL